jgi:hypothetical protein
MKPNRNMKKLMEAADGGDKADFEQRVQGAALDFHTLDRNAHVRSLTPAQQAKIKAIAKKIGDLADSILEIGT